MANSSQSPIAKVKYHLLPKYESNRENDSTQTRFIKNFNNTKEEDMATFSDFLRSKNQTAIQLTREVGRISYVITPLRFKYNVTDPTRARIIDCYGSNKRKPRIATLKVPLYGSQSEIQGERMDNVLEDPDGLILLKFITGFEIPKARLERKLETFSGAKLKMQRLCTSNLDSRKLGHTSVLWFRFYNPRNDPNFIISCWGSLDSYGGYALPVIKEQIKDKK